MRRVSFERLPADLCIICAHLIPRATPTSRHSHTPPVVTMAASKKLCNLKPFLIETLHPCLVLSVLINQKLHLKRCLNERQLRFQMWVSLPRPLAPMRPRPLQKHMTVAAPAQIRCYTNTNSSSLDKTDAISHKRDGDETMISQEFTVTEERQQ